MTEKEKMISCEMYNSSGSELTMERHKCKEMCYDYNNLRPTKLDERRAIIRELFGKVEGSFLIEPSLWCDYGYNIEIGDNFYSNHNLVILDCTKVTFGENVFIGPNCGFYTAGHPIEVEVRNGGLEYASPISVGNNVWIGGGTSVLPGVTIGDNCTIGGGSVVVKSIPANSIAVGNPCKVIRSI